MQLNELLSAEKYAMINDMRERLWITRETHITIEELAIILGLEGF